MSTRASMARRLALALIAHAKKIMPPTRSEWAQAMEHELRCIDADFEALRWAAGCVIASYVQNGELKMDQSFAGIARKPSAFLPLTMSLVALGLLGGAYVYGVATGHGGLVREADEGAVAHLWQLLMGGQIPVLLFFAIKWLPRAPKQTLGVIVLQIAAVLAAMAPVYLLHL